MPCIGIIGIKLTPEDLPESLYNLIFKNKNLKLSPEYHDPYTPSLDLNLKIYTINYNNNNKNIDLNFYINSYEDHIFNSIYIIYHAINSNKDKNNYFDNSILLDTYNISNIFNWSKSLEFLGLNCHNDIEFFVLEE